jgi:tetratricopeptide (TPR) repeat protein
MAKRTRRSASNGSGSAPRRRKKRQADLFSRVALLGLVALLVGLLVVFFEPLRERLGLAVNGRPELKERPPSSYTSITRRHRPDGSVVVERYDSRGGAVQQQKPVPSEGPRTVSRPPTGPEDATARMEIEEALSALNEGDLQAAERVLEDAARRDVGQRVYERIKRQRAKVRLFRDVARRNPPDRTAQVGNLYEIDLIGGGTVTGVIEEETAGDVQVSYTSGIKTRIKKDRIRSRTRVSGAERQAEKRDELSRKKLATRRTGEGRWRLARFAFKWGLRDEALGLLQEAWQLDENLPQTVYEARANALLREWAYYACAEIEHKSRKLYSKLKHQFPESQAVAMADEMLAEDREAPSPRPSAPRRSSAQPDPAQAESPPSRYDPEDRVNELINRADPGRAEPASSGSTTDRTGSADSGVGRPTNRTSTSGSESASGTGSLAIRARDAADLGMDKFKEGATHPNASEGRKLIQEAVEELKRAQDLYSKLMKQDPGNAMYQERYDGITRKLRWASRLRRL